MIHPFVDGNGRVARLWQTRLLMEVHPIFEHLDVESLVFAAREAYYAAICEAQDTGDAQCFVCFMLEQIMRSLSRLWDACGTVASQWDSRIDGVREHFGCEPFSRKGYLQLYKAITPVTASRGLKAAAPARRKPGTKQGQAGRLKPVHLRVGLTGVQVGVPASAGASNAQVWKWRPEREATS